MAASLFELVVTAFAPVRPADAMLLCAVGNAVLIAIAIIGVVASDLRKRPAFLWGACALAATVLARIGLFDFLVDNPLWSQQWVGATPVFDVLALSFAVPAAAAYFCANEFTRRGRQEMGWIAAAVAYALALVYVSFEVRHAFAGEYLDAAAIGSAEVYTYSAVWLTCGVVLLFAAVLRRDIVMRIASLVVLLLSVGKVFLYDASELTGLWRVVSGEG